MHNLSEIQDTNFVIRALIYAPAGCSFRHINKF